MARFRFRPDSTRKVSANIREFGVRKKRHLALALYSWAVDTKGDVQREYQVVGAFDQGITAAATDVSPVQQLGTKIRTTVFNPLEQASVIEFGRRARSGGPPPLLPLVGWSGRKGITTALPRNISFGGQWAKDWAASLAIFRAIERKGGGGGGSKSRQEPLDPVVRDMLIVRLIARKIFEKGTVGRHPFTRAWDRRVRTFRQDVASALQLLA